MKKEKNQFSLLFSVKVSKKSDFFLFLLSIFFNRFLKKAPLLLKIFPITIAWRCSRKKTHFSSCGMLISKPYSFIHISSR